MAEYSVPKVLPVNIKTQSAKLIINYLQIKLLKHLKMPSKTFKRKNIKSNSKSKKSLKSNSKCSSRSRKSRSVVRKMRGGAKITLMAVTDLVQANFQMTIKEFIDIRKNASNDPINHPAYVNPLTIHNVIINLLDANAGISFKYVDSNDNETLFLDNEGNILQHKTITFY